MFSFAPVIYITYRLAGIFINEAAAGERLYTRIEAVLGVETAAFIQDSVSAVAAGNVGGRSDPVPAQVRLLAELDRTLVEAVEVSSPQGKAV